MLLEQWRFGGGGGMSSKCWMNLAKSDTHSFISSMACSRPRAKGNLCLIPCSTCGFASVDDAELFEKQARNDLKKGKEVTPPNFSKIAKKAIQDIH